jgi:hypothetical protein
VGQRHALPSKPLRCRAASKARPSANCVLFVAVVPGGASLSLLLLSCTSFADTCVEIRKLKPVRHVCGIVANFYFDERLSNATLTLLKAGVAVKTIQSGLSFAVYPWDTMRRTTQ